MGNRVGIHMIDGLGRPQLRVCRAMRPWGAIPRHENGSVIDRRAGIRREEEQQHNNNNNTGGAQGPGMPLWLLGRRGPATLLPAGVEGCTCFIRRAAKMQFGLTPMCGI